jgi:hypothetical protein
MMNTISNLKHRYAEGGGVGMIDDTSDWSYFLVLEILEVYFLSLGYFYFFDGVFEFYFYLLFDPDLDFYFYLDFYLLFDFIDFYFYTF